MRATSAYFARSEAAYSPGGKQSNEIIPKATNLGTKNPPPGKSNARARPAGEARRVGPAVRSGRSEGRCRRGAGKARHPTGEPEAKLAERGGGRAAASRRGPPRGRSLRKQRATVGEHTPKGSGARARAVGRRPNVRKPNYRRRLVGAARLKVPSHAAARGRGWAGGTTAPRLPRVGAKKVESSTI